MAEQEFVKNVARARAANNFVAMHDVAVKMYEDIKKRHFPEDVEPFMWPQSSPSEINYVE